MIEYHSLPKVQHMSDRLMFVRGANALRFEREGYAGWVKSHANPDLLLQVYVNQTDDLLTLYDEKRDQAWARKQDNLPIADQIELVALTANKEN
jgi:hypothetical protein